MWEVGRHMSHVTCHHMPRVTWPLAVFDGAGEQHVRNTLSAAQTHVTNLKPTSSQPRPPFQTRSTSPFSHFLRRRLSIRRVLEAYVRTYRHWLLCRTLLTRSWQE